MYQRPNPGEKPKLFIFSEQYDHKRRRTLSVFLIHADGKEHLARLSFEDVTGELIDGTGRETVPGNNCNAPTIDAEHQYGLDGNEFLQAMLDAAWQQGFRPQGFFDTPNELAAIKAHLRDMRALVFKDDIKPRQIE